MDCDPVSSASSSMQAVARRTVSRPQRDRDGNGGHIWGTDLTESDRMALLEYLKIY